MTTKTNRCFTEEERARLDQIKEEMNIPAEDIAEGLNCAAQFVHDTPPTDENRENYFIMMAIAAYHAGKHAAEQP